MIATDNPFSPDGDPLVWLNHVIAQAAVCSAGLIPRHAVMLGVSVAGSDVTIHCQSTEIDDKDRENLGEIVSELDVLLELRCVLHVETTVRTAPDRGDRDDVSWIFQARSDRQHHGPLD